MSDSQKMVAGVLTGLMVTSDGHECIGISLSGMAMHVMGIKQAAVLFNQLGDLLDAAGYFEDEPPCPAEAKCKLH